MTSASHLGSRFDRERRRFPRLDVDGMLRGKDLTSELDLEIRNIGMGGFQALSPVASEPAHPHVVRLQISPERSYDLRARVVHCHRTPGIRPLFVTGWRLASDTLTTRGIVAILKALTSAASFDGGASSSELVPYPWSRA